MASEISRKSLLVSATGGVLDFVLNGEVLASVAVPPGRVRAAEYLDLLPQGAVIEVSKGLAVINPRHRIGVQPYGAGSHDSGANPDFQPTSASRLEKEMRLALAKMQAATDRLDRRERAMANIERVPKAPAPAPAPADDPEAHVVE